MKATRNKGGRLAKSFRGFGTRFSLFFFALVAVVLLILSQFNVRVLDDGRAAVIDGAAPVLNLANRPLEGVSDILAWSENLIFVYRENIRLKNDNERLKEWQLAAQKLSVENGRLRALLAVKDIKGEPVATGRVIGHSSGNFVRSIIINVGSNDGVARGQPVADASGIVGITAAVGRNSARVLLLTDLNSRVPVKILPADVNAILTGDNEDQPALIFLPGGVTLNVGDWVVTTGHGGVFPPDVAVGRIASLTEGGDPRVALAADFARLDYVRVYAYHPVDIPTTAAIELEPERSLDEAGVERPGETPSAAAPVENEPAAAEDGADDDDENELPEPPTPIAAPAPTPALAPAQTQSQFE